MNNKYYLCIISELFRKLSVIGLHNINFRTDIFMHCLSRPSGVFLQRTCAASVSSSGYLFVRGQFVVVPGWVSWRVLCRVVKMSGRVRKQSDCPVGKGPMRATLPVSSVMKQSGSLKKNTGNSPTLSPTNVWRRISPDHALSGQRSPGAVNYKGLYCILFRVEQNIISHQIL